MNTKLAEASTVDVKVAEARKLLEEHQQKVRVFLCLCNAAFQAASCRQLERQGKAMGCMCRMFSC